MAELHWSALANTACVLDCSRLLGMIFARGNHHHHLYIFDITGAPLPLKLTDDVSHTLSYWCENCWGYQHHLLFPATVYIHPHTNLQTAYHYFLTVFVMISYKRLSFLDHNSIRTRACLTTLRSTTSNENNINHISLHVFVKPLKPTQTDRWSCQMCKLLAVVSECWALRVEADGKWVGREKMLTHTKASMKRLVHGSLKNG